MKALVTRIDDVRKHPDADTLTIVTVGAYEVVANLDEEGKARWKVGELCVYVPEDMIVPDDVLKERGYWDDEKGVGMLGGSKGNRVKMRRFAGFESRGLLFKVGKSPLGDAHRVHIDEHPSVTRDGKTIWVMEGYDVSGFFDLKAHVSA